MQSEYTVTGNLEAPEHVSLHHHQCSICNQPTNMSWAATNTSYHTIQIQCLGDHKYIKSITNIFRVPTPPPHTNRGPQMRLFASGKCRLRFWGTCYCAIKAFKDFEEQNSVDKFLFLLSKPSLRVKSREGGLQKAPSTPGALDPTIWLLLVGPRVWVKMWWVAVV